MFAPSAVSVWRDAPHGSPRNTVAVTVAELDSRDSRVRVRAEEQPGGRRADRRGHCRGGGAARLTAGDRIWLSVKAQEVTLHPAAGRHTG